MKPINRIHQLAFDVNFTAAPADELALPYWIQENLLPVIDQVIQKLDEELHERMGSAGNIIRIKRLEKLEIDLGTVDQAESASELQRRLHNQLMNALAFEFAEKTEHSVREHEANTLKNQLLNFLSTGQLNWSLEQQGKQAHRHLLNNLLSYVPSQLPNPVQDQSQAKRQTSHSQVVETCLSQILSEDVRLTRLVRQFDTPELFQILKINLRNWSLQEQELILDWISLELLRLSNASSNLSLNLSSTQRSPLSSTLSSSQNRELQQDLWKQLLKASAPTTQFAAASASSLPTLILSWLRPRQLTLMQAFEAYAQIIDKDRSLSNTTRSALQLVLKNLSDRLIGDGAKLALDEVTDDEKNNVATKERDKEENGQAGEWTEAKVQALRGLILAGRTMTETHADTFTQSRESKNGAYQAILNAIQNADYDTLPQNFHTEWQQLIQSQAPLWRTLQKSAWTLWLRHFPALQCLEIIAVLQPRCAWFISRHKTVLTNLGPTELDHLLTLLLSAKPDKFEVNDIQDILKGTFNRTSARTLDSALYGELNGESNRASKSAIKNQTGKLEKLANKAAPKTRAPATHPELNEVLQAWPSLLQKPYALRALFQRHQQQYLHKLPLSHLLDLLHLNFPNISKYWQPDLELIADIENQARYEHSLRQFLQKLFSENPGTLSAHSLSLHLSEQLAQDPTAEFLLHWIKTTEQDETVADNTAHLTTIRLEQELKNSDQRTLNAAIEQALKIDLPLLHRLRPKLWRHWLAHASDTQLSRLACQFQIQVGQVALNEFFSRTESVTTSDQHSTRLSALALLLATRPGSLDAKQLRAISEHQHSSPTGASDLTSIAVHQAIATDEANELNTVSKTDEDDRKNAPVLFERMLATASTTSADSKSILSQLMHAHSKELVPLWRVSQPSQRSKLLSIFELDDKIDLLALLYPSLAQVLHPTIRLLEQSSAASPIQPNQDKENGDSALLNSAVSVIQVGVEQFTLLIHELLLSDNQQENSIKQRLEKFYEKFLKPSFNVLSKTDNVSATLAPSLLQGKSQPTTKVSQLQTIWLTLLDHPQEPSSEGLATERKMLERTKNEAQEISTEFISNEKTKTVTEAVSTHQAQISDELILNGLNPLLYAFRQWQLSHLQLAQLELTVEELEQFLHWWILQQSSNDTSNPPDNYALMLESIKDAMQESAHPALLMELLLESLRDDQVLDLEAIKLQVNNKTMRLKTQRVLPNPQAQEQGKTGLVKQHFLLRLDDLTNNELAEDTKALQARMQEEPYVASMSYNKATSSNSSPPETERKTHLNFKQNLVRIFADAHNANEFQASTSKGKEHQHREQINSKLEETKEHSDLEHLNVLANHELIRWRQNMPRVLSNPAFHLWTIEWLNAQLEALANLSVIHPPSATHSATQSASNFMPDFISDLAADIMSDVNAEPTIAQIKAQTQAALGPDGMTSPEDFALLLVAMSEELPPALYQRWQLTASSAFGLDKAFFENLSQHPLPTSLALYQACAEHLAASHWMARNQTLSNSVNKQNRTLELQSTSDISMVGNSSNLPTQLRETLPHKLAHAMINGQLDSLEWIWDDIKRHHANLLQQAQRRYLKNSSLREKIIAHHTIGQLFDLVENLSATAATCLKELWQAWDICRQYLNPTMDLSNCQKQSCRSALTYLLNQDSARPQLNEFMRNILEALSDNLSYSHTVNGHTYVSWLPDLLAACIEELDLQPTSYVPHLKAALREIRQVRLLVDEFKDLLDWQEPVLAKRPEHSGHAICPVLDKTQVQNLFVQTICTQAPSLLESILRHQDRSLSTESIENAKSTKSEELQTNGASNVNIAEVEKTNASSSEHFLSSPNSRHLNSLSENQLQTMLYARLQHGTELEQQKFWKHFAERLQTQQNSLRDSLRDSLLEPQQQSQQIINQRPQAVQINQSLRQLFTAPIDDDRDKDDQNRDENTDHCDLLIHEKRLSSTITKVATSEELATSTAPLNAIQASWLSHLTRLLGSHQELSLPEQKYVTLTLSQLDREHESAWTDFILALNHTVSLNRYLQLATLHDLARLFRLLRPTLAKDIQDIIASLETVFNVSLSLNAKLLTRASWQAIYRAEISNGKTHRYQDFLLRLLTELASTHALPEPSVAMEKLASYKPTLEMPVAATETGHQLKLSPYTNQNKNQHIENINKSLGEKLRHSLQDDFNQERSSNKAALESYISNAGMVIIAPYVQRLFGLLELIENGSFISDTAAQRAVHLLQYVVTGETQTPEFQLTLNKLLCGIHGGVPIVTGIDISPHEENVIQQMLQGVIGHWRVLGNTSIQGLRETFLQRQGNLYFEEDGWRLKIEQGSFDMLLDQLPWSFAMIKFPWMSDPLHVNWR